MTGCFITLEGPEGSGKSTQAKRLSERLEAAGHEVILTREPGGTPVGEAIRNVLQHDSAGDGMPFETEIFLFEASRAALVSDVICPALEAGKIVICDRFADSTTVYQGYGRGYAMDVLCVMNDTACRGLKPDLTLVLDIGVEMGFARLESRNTADGTVLDRMERQGREFHERVRAGYLTLAEENPDRCHVIDAGAGVDDVAERVWSVVSSRLKE